MAALRGARTMLYVTHFMIGIMLSLRVFKHVGAGGTCDDANSSGL
jgi:hypothetical protein